MLFRSILARGALGARLHRPPLAAAFDEHAPAGPAVHALSSIGEALPDAPTRVELAGGVRGAIFHSAPLMAARLHLDAASNPLAIALRLVDEARVHARLWAATAIVSTERTVGTGKRARPLRAAGSVQLTAADERAKAALISRLARGQIGRAHV